MWLSIESYYIQQEHSNNHYEKSTGMFQNKYFVKFINFGHEGKKAQTRKT